MPETRIEVHEGPDSLGRYRFTLRWLSDYHPGHPDGEYALRERGQVFHARLPLGIPVFDRRAKL